MSRTDALANWRGSDVRTYIAEVAARVTGAYLLKPNQPGRGSHIANAAFIVASVARNRGVGRRMAEHCLAEASRLGFRGMQFNYVVSANARAPSNSGSSSASQSSEPGAFRLQEGTFVDVFVMFRTLPL